MKGKVSAGAAASNLDSHNTGLILTESLIRQSSNNLHSLRRAADVGSPVDQTGGIRRLISAFGEVVNSSSV